MLQLFFSENAQRRYSEHSAWSAPLFIALSSPPSSRITQFALDRDQVTEFDTILKDLEFEGDLR